MDVLTAIQTRRSVRRFTPKMVPEAKIEHLIRAAMQAPSSGNSQPWHFIVISDRNLLEKVPEFHPFAESLHTAPVAILICADPRLGINPGRWPLDCAAATENILLAAHAEGLGAVWLGVYPDDQRINGIRKLIPMPDEIQPVTMVALGYAEATPAAVDRFLPDRIHRNQW